MKDVEAEVSKVHKRIFSIDKKSKAVQKRKNLSTSRTPQEPYKCR
jgi:hypothetical protein